MDDVLVQRQRYFSKSNSVSYANTGPLMFLQVRSNSSAGDNNDRKVASSCGYRRIFVH